MAAVAGAMAAVAGAAAAAVGPATVAGRAATRAGAGRRKGSPTVLDSFWIWFHLPLCTISSVITYSI